MAKDAEQDRICRLKTKKMPGKGGFDFDHLHWGSWVWKQENEKTGIKSGKQKKEGKNRWATTLCIEFDYLHLKKLDLEVKKQGKGKQ